MMIIHTPLKRPNFSEIRGFARWGDEALRERLEPNSHHICPRPPASPIQRSRPGPMAFPEIPSHFPRLFLGNPITRPTFTAQPDHQTVPSRMRPEIPPIPSSNSGPPSEKLVPEYESTIDGILVPTRMRSKLPFPYPSPITKSRSYDGISTP
jgi:hypothetical protein